MSETVTVSPTSDAMRAFSIQRRNAEERVKEAGNFIDAFRTAHARGKVVSESSAREVEGILRIADERLEVAAFKLAVAAGESNDIDRHLETGQQSLENLEQTTTRLRAELAKVRGIVR